MKKLQILFVLGMIVLVSGLMPGLEVSRAQDTVPNAVSKLTWSANGNALAVVDLYGVTVYRLDDVEAEPIHFGQELSISISQVVLSPDGALAATLHDSDSLQILAIDEELASGLGWVWDTTTGERLYELDGHEELRVLTAVEFSLDGQYLAYGGLSDGTVYVKDSATGETVASLNPQENDPAWEPGLVIPPLDGLQFDPTGSFLLTHHRAQFTMWQIESWDEIGQLTGTPNIFSNFVMADGGYAVAAVDTFGNPFAWLMRDASSLLDTEIGEYEVDAVGFNGNPSVVAVTLNPELAVDQLELIELETETTNVITIEGLDLSGDQTTLQFIGNGQLLVLVQASGMVRYSVVDIDEAQLIVGFDSPGIAPLFAVGRDGTHMVVRDEANLMILNLETGEVTATIELPSQGPFPPLK